MVDLDDSMGAVRLTHLLQEQRRLKREIAELDAAIAARQAADEHTTVCSCQLREAVVMCARAYQEASQKLDALTPEGDWADRFTEIMPYWNARRDAHAALFAALDAARPPR